MLGVVTILIGLGIVASPGREVRAVTIFSQIGADINGESAGDNSGSSVAMSADGTRVAISAYSNDGNGNDAGHVRVYSWNGTTWTQTGSDINGEYPDDYSGASIAISADGTRVAVGATGNDGNDPDAGHVRVYTLTNGDWTPTGNNIYGEASGDNAGYSVAMSANGDRIAIGATGNSNRGTASRAGHVRVYNWSGTAWNQTGNSINGEAVDDYSGRSVAMSADGARVAIGATGNDGNGSNAGHVRVYSLTGNTWTQTGNSINGEATSDNSGSSVAMSADGTRIAIGATGNDANGSNAGHVRVYSLTGNTWTQTGTDINGEATSDNSGWSVAMSADGTRVAIGATDNDGNGSDAGHVRVYSWTGTAWTQTGTDINGESADDYFGASVAMSADGTRVAIGATGNDGNFSNAGHVRAYTEQNSPSAPTISSVIAADGSLTVSFTAGSDGGSTITNYKYSIDGTNYIELNPATTTSPFTIGGLTNGTTYSASIKAMNGVGDSAASSALTGIPVAPAPATTTTTIAPPAATTTTTIAPPAATTTTVATVTTASVQKVIETKNELPVTGSNSSLLIAFSTILLSVGLVVITRRRVTS